MGNNVSLLMASRIHGDVYVRFRGRYAETCRRKAVRRCIPSLQTNLKEARPELWEKLEQENGRPFVHEGEMFSFEPADRMIRDNLWICPINVRHQDDAYYSISKNEITVPEKVQFKSGESFYGTLFHEMGHSTGAEGVLDRFKPTAFGSKEYSDEELVAELCGALTAQRYGITKHIKEDSCPYLKSWLDNLKESPQYIKTVLMDVKKASSMITQKIDQIAKDIEIEKAEKQEQTEAPKEKMYYASVAYLQMADDTRQLEELKDKGDYNGLLTLAKEYYDGNGMDEQYTYSSPLQNRGDDLLIEDQNFAVVYNGSVGGTYDIMLKYTEEEVRDHIRRYGIGRASNDVKEVAKAMVAEQFAEISQKNIPAFEMPNGEVLYINYNREKDTLDAGSATNAGLAVQHSFKYNHDKALDDNLTEVNEKLESMEGYQEEEEIERSGFRR